jgi:hypothetical protein
MNEKPILFNAEMVQAILEGRKTQTRRPIDFKKIFKETGCSNGKLAYSDTFKSWAVFNGNGGADICLCKCPFGKVGDRLWVRETFSVYRQPENPVVHYKADCPNDKSLKWKPSIHMPRWASRITLEITKIRIERVMDITEKDAKKEGCLYAPDTTKGFVTPWWMGFKGHFQYLWASIYGTWGNNPWVWVVEFKPV